MALTKTAPITVDTATAQLAALKTRADRVASEVASSKIRLEFLKKQYDDLVKEAQTLGVTDIKEISVIMKKLEDELVDLTAQVETNLAEAERIINEH